MGDQRLGVLLNLSVGRLMRRTAERERGRTDAAFTDDRIRHVSDWLKAALVNRDAWLDNVDAAGRPKKLLKHPSFEALLAEVDRAMIVSAQKMGNVRLVDGDEMLHAELEDGMVLVEMLTPSALDRESSMMQHCIGNGGYDAYLGMDGRHFLSLRDRHGKAHATLEIVDGMVKQLKGKQNDPPVRKYVEFLARHIRASGHQVDVPQNSLGYVVDMDGAWHDIDNLPEGLSVAGNLDLRGMPVTSLPDGLSIGGSLYVIGTAIRTLPRRLRVGGYLDAASSSIATIPDDISLGGSLDLAGSPIGALPKGLRVPKTLNLRGAAILALPERLWVGEHLDIRGTAINALPEGIEVGLNIYMGQTEIASLPDSIADTVRIFSNGSSFTAPEFRQRLRMKGY